MRRREFLTLAGASAAAACLPGCSLAFGPRLADLPGLTSIHDHVDSDEAVDRMREAMDRVGIDRMNLVGCYASILHGEKTPAWDSKAENNELLLRTVGRFPDRFTAFVLMDGSEADPVQTLEGYLARGARGVKLYNGVSNAHRFCPLDDARLAPLLRFCDLHGVPILVHVDPRHLPEALAVVRGHRSIPWIVPHLLVLSGPGDMERLDALLTRLPHLSTDLSFGFASWMDDNFRKMSAARDALRDVVLAHADQVLFGTDIVFTTKEPWRTVDWAEQSLRQYRLVLETERFPFEVRSRKKTYEATLDGLHLPHDVLRRVCVENARRFLDLPAPRPQDDDLHTVLSDLPPGAVPDPAGPWHLLALAARPLLADRTTPPSSVATLRSLAPAVAAALGRSVDRIFDDPATLKDAAEPTTLVVLPLAALDPRFTPVSPAEGVPTATLPPLDGAVARCAAVRAATRAAAFAGWPLLLPVRVEGDVPPEARLDLHEIRSVVLSGCTLLGEGMTADPLPTPEDQVAELRPVLGDADLVHASVENAGREKCSQDLEKWRFCWTPDRLAALDRLGVDVLELTGNHLADAGPKALQRTLERYETHGLALFGGGRDLDAARTPAVLPVRGLRIGFVGVNRVNARSGGAAADRAGPLVPSDDAEVDQLLERVRAASDVFFFTSHGGYEFSPTPHGDQVRLARQAVDAGAIGVHGTHAHAPMGVEVRDGSFVAYGPGNLLFRHPGTVRPRSEATEQGFLVRHVLLGRRSVAAVIVPLHMRDGVVGPLAAAETGPLRQRVLLGSRPGLQPHRALPPLANARVEVADTDAAEDAWRHHLKGGVATMLLGLSEDAARAAGSPEAALARLREAADACEKRGSTRVLLALPLLDGWTLPADGFHAVRLWIRPDGDPVSAVSLLRIAARSGRPVQVPAVADLDRLTAAVDVPLLVGGLPDLPGGAAAATALLRTHPHLHLDLGAAGSEALERWITGVLADPDPWRRFFEDHADRVLFAAPPPPRSEKASGDQVGRFVRAVTGLLAEDTFRLPRLRDGRTSEWAGYDYCAEPEVRGLALSEGALAAICGGNLVRLAVTPV